MRNIGHVDQTEQAERFIGHLAALGIEGAWRPEDSGASVWTLNEDDLSKAEEELIRFKADPSIALPAPKANKNKPADPNDRARVVDVRSEIFSKRDKIGSVTLFLIIASIMATIVMSVPGAVGVVRALYFSEYMGRHFPEISGGEVWRLVTPIFMHGGIMHLAFNMLWVYQLGGMIEKNEGSRYFGLFALSVAVLVNTAQYLVAGPLFVGMSGVVYAMLGYIWAMERYEAGSKYQIAQETVVIMLIWMGICLVGLIPGVANTQHVAGFLIGVFWGFLRSGEIKTRLRRRRYKRPSS